MKGIIHFYLKFPVNWRMRNKNLDLDFLGHWGIMKFCMCCFYWGNEHSITRILTERHEANLTWSYNKIRITLTISLTCILVKLFSGNANGEKTDAPEAEEDEDMPGYSRTSFFNCLRDVLSLPTAVSALGCILFMHVTHFWSTESPCCLMFGITAKMSLSVFKLIA